MHHIFYAGRIRPLNSKIVRRADCPVHHICNAGRSALLPAKWCAEWTALCIIFDTQGGPPSYQKNGEQGGPPCASYKLRRAVCPPTSKMVCRVDCPVHPLSNILARRKTVISLAIVDQPQSSIVHFSSFCPQAFNQDIIDIR